MRVSQVEIEPVLQRAVKAAARGRRALERRLRGLVARRRWRHRDVAHGERRGRDGALPLPRSAATAAPARCGAASALASTARHASQQRYMTHFRSDARDLLQRFRHRLALPDRRRAPSSRRTTSTSGRCRRGWPEDLGPNDVDPARTAAALCRPRLRLRDPGRQCLDLASSAWPRATERAACSSPATPRTSTSRPAATA